ncbi:MAG: hypothetical protein AAGA96_15305 [Verrucomicrobiota bacterium]
MNLLLKALSLIDSGLRRLGGILLSAFRGKTTGQVLLLILGVNGALIGLGLILPDAAEDPTEHFKEFRFLTFFSVLQLLACAALAWMVFHQRHEPSASPRPVRIRIQLTHLWAFIALGFLFLAADDLLLIHEITDKLIHVVGGIKETTATDKIDDFIIALYGLGALALLWMFRREFLPFAKQWAFFVGAFLCLAATIALDLELTTSLIPLIPGSQTLLSDPWRGVLEEVFKLFGEAFFLVAFYGCYLQATTREPHHRPKANQPAERVEEKVS